MFYAQVVKNVEARRFMKDDAFPQQPHRGSIKSSWRLELCFSVSFLHYQTITHKRNHGRQSTQALSTLAQHYGPPA